MAEPRSSAVNTYGQSTQVNAREGKRMSPARDSRRASASRVPCLARISKPAREPIGPGCIPARTPLDA